MNFGFDRRAYEAELRALPPDALLARLRETLYRCKSGTHTSAETEAYTSCWFVAGERGLDAERKRAAAEVRARAERERREKFERELAAARALGQKEAG